MSDSQNENAVDDAEQSDPVFVAGRGTGGSTEIYHEDEDCRMMKQASSVHAYSRARVVDRRRPCLFCARDRDD
jgi:hypothetical protein